MERCIQVLESRGLEEQGLYRTGGVTSKVNKLLSMGLDRRKTDKLNNLDDPLEWENKTITSALKSFLRTLPEPLMTYKYHAGFISAASKYLTKTDEHETQRFKKVRLCTTVVFCFRTRNETDEDK